MADSPMEERDREREREISDGLTVFGYFFFFLLSSKWLPPPGAVFLSLSLRRRGECTRERVCVCGIVRRSLIATHTFPERKEKRET